MQEDDRLSLVADIDQIKILWQHEINVYANDILVSPSDVSSIVGWLSDNDGVGIGALFGHFSKLEKPRLWRTLAWLQKLGIVKNSACQG
jgi:hypothetical protein